MVCINLNQKIRIEINLHFCHLVFGLSKPFCQIGFRFNGIQWSLVIAVVLSLLSLYGISLSLSSLCDPTETGNPFDVIPLDA